MNRLHRSSSESVASTGRLKSHSFENSLFPKPHLKDSEEIEDESKIVEEDENEEEEDDE